MRQGSFEVMNAPSYLLYPQNRRVEYGGGFRIIKPQQQRQNVIQKQPTQYIPLIPEIQPVADNFIPPIKTQVRDVQPPKSIREYGYDYYHGDIDFTNFFGLENQNYHICMQHDPNCHICHTCKTDSKYNQSNCYLCSKKYSSKPKKEYSKTKNVRPSSGRDSREVNKNKDVKEQESKQIISLGNESSDNFNDQKSHESEKINEIYQIIDEPIIPKNATLQQKAQYQRKYKEHLLKKRDLYYLTILKKMIQKIDFQRYQCTSPNEERISADWFGVYKPRTMQTAGGKVKYQIENHPGYQFLKSFIFVYLYQNKYKQKDDYQTNAQAFLNHFQELLLDTSKNPTKALHKLQAESYRRVLEGKISKEKLRDFMNRLKFIELIFGLENINEKLDKLPNQLDLKQYKRIFTMKIKPELVNKSLTVQAVKRGNSGREQKQQKITFKHVFPEIQKLEHQEKKTFNESDFHNKKLGIRQKRLLQDLMQKQAEEQELIDYRFKAKPIPKEVVDRSLYGKIMDEKAKQSAQNREKSAKQLLQNDNAFSFYYRDLDKQNPIEQFRQFKSFKASQIPKHVTQPRYQRMMEQKEEAKKRNLEQRQAELLASSKFPATMGYLENYSTLKSKSQQQLPYKFQPDVSKNVPNFEELHKKSIKQLQNKKLNNKSITSPEQFNLSKGNKRKVVQHSLPETQQIKKKISHSTNKSYMAGSTLKYDALIEHRRKQAQQKQLKQSMLQSNFKPKLNQHQQVLKQRLHNTLRQVQSPGRGNFVLPPQQWNELSKQQMMKKVYQKSPMLIDRKYERVNGMKVQTSLT